MMILIKRKMVVTKLKCKGCTKHKLRKHFSNKWIEGADSVRTSDIRDYNAEHHIHVMEIEKAEPRANHILCLHFQLIMKSYLSVYICGWPNG